MTPETPPAPADRTPVELRSYDAAGDRAPPRELPRWPRFEILSDAPLSDPGEAVFLFPGAADDELLEDLARRPLRAANLARALPLRASTSSTTWLAPETSLEPGEYTLALAAWALDALGQPPAPDGPLLWSLRVSPDAAAGARVAATFPPDGALALGTHLRAVVVAFDGSVQADAAAIWIEDPHGHAIPAMVEFGPCAPGVGVECATLEPAGRLMPAAEHRLRVSAGLRDLHGAPVGPFEAALHVGAGPDRQAPRIGVPGCAIDERATPLGCALSDDRSIVLRLELDEPARVHARAGDRELHAWGGPGELALRFAPLPADAAFDVQLELRDAAGNVGELAHPLATTEPLATLSIVEVLADPVGPEPAQELVELLNFGAQPVDLAGVALADALDRPGSAIEAQLLLPAGQRVLLTADDYDASAPGDVAPPPGALRIAMGRSLASSGLSNAGEALYLRDAHGRRLSAAPAQPKPRRGRCLVRTGEEPRTGGVEHFELGPEGDCTPGW